MPLLSDAARWATILFIAIGGASAGTAAVVWLLTLPATGRRIQPPTAGRIYRRIATAAVATFLVLFLGGMIAGAFQ